MSTIPSVTPATSETLPLDVALSYAERLLTRRDTYAVQQPDGRYVRVAEPFNRDALVAHLTGERTVAIYALDRQRQSRWLCFDSDTPDGLVHLLVVQQALAALGITASREASRRGGHLWVFCAQLLPAALLSGLARGVLALLAARGELPDAVAQRMEVYPTADHLGVSGYSQPVRAPFGVHQRTGLIYPFLDIGARPAHGLAVLEGIQWLLRQPLTSPALIRAASHKLERQLEGALDHVALALGERANDANKMPSAILSAARGPHDGKHMSPNLGTGRTSLITWINANVELPDLVAEMSPGVQLRPMGQGFGGWCPYHDDEGEQVDGKSGTPSLYVVRSWRYGWSWRCYSTNCGANRPLMQHTFDWLIWMTGGDVRRALSWARTRYGMYSPIARLPN